MERRLQSACSLAIQNFATSDFNQEQRNSRCPLSMSYTPILNDVLRYRIVYTYSAWASVVARSVEVGNAKALYSGMSD